MLTLLRYAFTALFWGVVGLVVLTVALMVPGGAGFLIFVFAIVGLCRLFFPDKPQA